jgi:hypothetical protein
MSDIEELMPIPETSPYFTICQKAERTNSAGDVQLSLNSDEWSLVRRAMYIVSRTVRVFGFEWSRQWRGF